MREAGDVGAGQINAVATSYLSFEAVAETDKYTGAIIGTFVDCSMCQTGLDIEGAAWRGDQLLDADASLPRSSDHPKFWRRSKVERKITWVLH